MVQTFSEAYQRASFDGAHYNVWAVNVKLAWGVPRATRTYILQQCLAPGSTSAKTEILARFVGFFRGLRKSSSHEVRTVALMAARDMRTCLGRNLRVVEELSGGLDPWVASTSTVRSVLSAREAVSVPEGAEFRLPYLLRLLEHRQELHYHGLQGDEEDVQRLIDSLCVN